MLEYPTPTPPFFFSDAGMGPKLPVCKATHPLSYIHGPRINDSDVVILGIRFGDISYHHWRMLETFMQARSILGCGNFQFRPHNKRLADAECQGCGVDGEDPGEDTGKRREKL